MDFVVGLYVVVGLNELVWTLPMLLWTLLLWTLLLLDYVVVELYWIICIGLYVDVVDI
jgi:hypothetical protein